MAVNKIVAITNTTHQVGNATSLSIMGEPYRASILPNSTLSVDLISIQFDEAFLDDLCNKMDQGFATVTID